MPLYNIACRKPLAQKVREEIAVVVSEVHCRLTDAPPAFVNVVYLDNQPLKPGHSLSVIAGVRSGGNRNEASLATLQEQMQRAIAEAATLPEEQVVVQLLGFPANWIMEGGEVLPDPGAESDEWYAKPESSMP